MLAAASAPSLGSFGLVASILLFLFAKSGKYKKGREEVGGRCLALVAVGLLSIFHLTVVSAIFVLCFFYEFFSFTVVLIKMFMLL